jgi:hypothetical protein
LYTQKYNAPIKIAEFYKCKNLFIIIINKYYSLFSPIIF